MSSLREVISTAIVNRFEANYSAHGSNYDPDTCYEAADDVIAALSTQLLGVSVVAVHGSIIGPAVFRLEDK